MSARLPSPSALSNPTLLFGLPSSKFSRSSPFSALSSCTSSPSTHSSSSHGTAASFHNFNVAAIPVHSSSPSSQTSSSRNGSNSSSFSTASLASRYRPTPLPSPVPGVESPMYEGATPSFEYDTPEQLPGFLPASPRPSALTHTNSYASSPGASTDSSFSATQSPVYSTFDHSRASSSASGAAPSHAAPSPLSQDITHQTSTQPTSKPDRPLSIDLSSSAILPSDLPTSTSLPNPIRPSMSRSQLSYSNHMKSHVASLIESVSREVALKRAEASARRLAEANEKHAAQGESNAPPVLSDGRKRTTGVASEGAGAFDARREWGETAKKDRSEREKREKAAREEASEREREREMREVGGGWRKIGVL